MICQTSKNKCISVNMAPHPFAVERIQGLYPAGLTVQEMIEKLKPENCDSRFLHVYLDGHYIPRENWARVKPKAGTILTVRAVPMGGGGGKNPLRTVLSLALAVASPQIAAGLNGILGTGTAIAGFNIGGVVTSSVNLIGRLALNAVAPPGRSRFSSNTRESATLFLQGARNQALPFGRIPHPLGTHRLVPPMGAWPYTETVGNDQYLRMLFVWGYGPLQISDLKIGETPLEEFDGVEIETRQGYADDAPLTLYARSVLQNDLQINATHAAGYIQRTTEADVDEISVDITFPRGLVRFAGSVKLTTNVKMEIQYSPAEQNQWSAGTDTYTPVAQQTVFGVNRPLAYWQRGMSYTVVRLYRVILDPSAGSVSIISGPDFREGIDGGQPALPLLPDEMIELAHIERRSSDALIIPAGRITDMRAQNLFGPAFENSSDFLVSAGVAANSINVATGGLKFTRFDMTAAQAAALRKSVSFKVPRGQYDVRVRRITEDATDDNLFDETHWTALRSLRYEYPVNMTGLAVSALRIKATDQLSGVLERFNGVVQSILPDWTGTEWTEQVTSNPASLYRHVLQGTSNARPLGDHRIDLARLQSWHDACQDAGREFNAVIDYDVAVREVLADIAAAGRAAPALIDGKWTIVEDAASSVPVQHFTPRNTHGFHGKKAFDDLPHGLRVRFINPDEGWVQDERLVFDDGYDADTAIKYETLELPGITSSQQAWKDGRYHIATARLRPETYSFYTDVEHLVCTRGDLIRFTHDVPLFGVMSARVVRRSEDAGQVSGVTLDADVTMEPGKNYAARFRRQDGSAQVHTLVFDAGPTVDLIFASAVPAASAPVPGDLVMFGESGQESVELIVKAIEPQGNLAARLTCVDAAPAVHTADTGAIPVHNPQVTIPADIRRPPAPMIANLQSANEAVRRNEDGSFEMGILISFTPPEDYAAPLTLDIKIKKPEETEYAPALFIQNGNTIRLSDVEEGAHYDMKFAYKNPAGLTSAVTTISNYKVEGFIHPPGNVVSFDVTIAGTMARLSWQGPDDINLAGYRIRFTHKTSNVTWPEAFDLGETLYQGVTSLTVPAEIGTWMIKAVDTQGRESADALAAVASVTQVGDLSGVATLDESATFGGMLPTGSSGVVFNAQDQLVLDDALSGTYVFSQSSDLGHVYTCYVTADVGATGLSLSNLIDDWNSVDAVEDWDGAQDPSSWDARLQVRTTSDDPVGSPTWTAWRSFSVGEYTARAFEFRLLLSALLEGVTPAVNGLTVQIGMPQLVQGRDNISAAASDSPATHVTFDYHFHSLSALIVTSEDMTTGDYYTVSNKTAGGFDIAFFDAANTRIIRTFDYIAQGIGRKETS